MPAQSHALDCNFVSAPCRTSTVCVFFVRKSEASDSDSAFQAMQISKCRSSKTFGVGDTMAQLRKLPQVLGFENAASPPVSKIQPITPDCTSYFNSISISYSQFSLHAFKKTQIDNQITVAGKCFIIGRNLEQDQAGETTQRKTGWVGAPQLQDYNIIYLYNICAKDSHQHHFSFCCIFRKGLAVKWNVIFSENLTFKRKFSCFVYVNSSGQI